MQTTYHKWYSPSLEREMEVKTWGHDGFPVLFIPCQNGRFFDFENFNMTDVYAPWIESGKVKVYSIDTVDEETWSDRSRSPRERAEIYERWIDYICNEIVPMAGGNMMVTGCSLGATHAAVLFYRRPDLFSRLLAISGIYSASYGFDDYMDDLVYYFSPIDFLGGMPKDHPYIDMYNSGRSIICTGQGAWEQPDYAKTLEGIFRDKGINTWVDLWGYDVNHDWPWWYKMTEYFLPKLID